ncbi:MAG: hypothetical protein NC078_01625 [Ruminococcus sp.]|nr:hypothetical protein [Ruminococcus sp.]
MNIENFKDNDKFYNGFEDEPEITLSVLENPEYNIHIWDGYFTFIFGKPVSDGKGWNGFTRDYNQTERVFGDDDYVIKDVKEYLDDMQIYRDKDFGDEEAGKCFRLLEDFLKFALENNYRILTHVF